MASVIFLAAILFGLFILGLIYKTCIEGRIKFASLKTIPTIGKRHFLWGHLHLNKKPGSPEFIKQHFDLMKQYKHLYQLWIGNLFPYVVICSGEAAGVILKHTRNIEKSRPYTKIQPWLGLSVLTSTGSIWKQKRRMLTPAFHYNILQDYIPIYHQCGSIMMEKLQQAADSKAPVEIFRLITTCTLDIIGLCAFGYDIEAQKGNTDYVTSIYKLSTLFATSIYSPQLVLIRLIFGEKVFETFTEVGREWKKSYQIVHELPDRVIKSRREALQRGDQGGVCSVTRTGKTYTDFLHILLTTTNSETGQPLGDQEVRDEVDTFMFEGHDTTSSGLVWAMYELATHPEAQKKVAQELDEIMGDKEYPDYEDLEKMNYLYCVIKETLRLHPPVPEIGRVLSEPVDILGHHLPAGTQLTINPYLIHRNPLDWKKPDDFIPERFDVNSPEYDPDRNAYSFVPFSAGPRNCIGQNFALNEEKTLLAMVFKKYFVEISPDQPLPVEPIIEIITRPSGGVRLTIKERSAL